MKAQLVKGHFSETAGSRVRTVYGPDDEFLGIIQKASSGGYRVIRRDGKVRDKSTLKDAYKTCARAN